MPVRLPATVGYLLAYVAAFAVGRVDMVLDPGIALFWPAAGVASLWMLRGATKEQVTLDATVLALSTTLLFLGYGEGIAPALLLAAANVVQGFAVRVVSARSARLPLTGPLSRGITSSRELRALIVGATVASVLSYPFARVALHLAGGQSAWVTGWVVRNSCGTLLVAAASLTIMGAIHARPRGAYHRLAASYRSHSNLELCGVGAATLVGGYLAFAMPHQLILAYAMVGTMAWLGLRFSPLVVATYTLGFGPLAIAFTLAGRGPFGSMRDPMNQAIVAQFVVAITVLVVLMLAFATEERRALIVRLAESEAETMSRNGLLTAVMTAMTDGLVVLGASGTVMMHNHAADVLAGDPDAPEDVGTAASHGLFHTDGSDWDPGVELARVFRGETVPPEDFLRIDPHSGQRTTLSISFLPLPGTRAEGAPLAVVVLHDVTAERARRRELQSFAGTVAHDLKTPLSGVGSWAEILGDQLDDLEKLGGDVVEPRASLARIATSADRMEQLIADLLAYSQAQNAIPTPSSLDLEAVVDAVAKDLCAAATGTLPVIEHGPLNRVLADLPMVGQLLTNVIGNAVKYVAPDSTPHIVVASELRGDMVEVRVRDNGIGIPPAERGLIFDSFYRAPNARAYPGTGLGLAICARIVEQHGGRISAREGLDHTGTTLAFTLPADPGPLAKPRPRVARGGDTNHTEPPPGVGSATAVS